MNVTDLKRAAYKTVDERGQPVVQIPLKVWEEFVGEEELEPEIPQYERIKRLLDSWKNEPDDKDDAWWDDFMQFLKDNRVSFEERDLNWGDA